MLAEISQEELAQTLDRVTAEALARAGMVEPPVDALRLLDFSSPVIVSVFDQNQLTWRKSNVPERAPKPGDREIACRKAAHESGSPCCDPGPPTISVWPIHEAEWQREIVRIDLSELAFDGFA
jgi:hypothetical protein